MGNVEELLSLRVDELIRSRERVPRPVMLGTRAMVESLVERMAVVEEAVRRLAEAVEELTAVNSPDSRHGR